MPDLIAFIACLLCFIIGGGAGYLQGFDHGKRRGKMEAATERRLKGG